MTNKKTELTGPLSHLSDARLAIKVRMLTRTDLDHEAVCVAARNRILYLSTRPTHCDSEALKLLEWCQTEGTTGGWLEDSPMYREIQSYLTKHKTKG